MIFLEERIGRLLKDLEELIYSQPIAIKHYKYKQTRENFKCIETLQTDNWDDFSHENLWGGHQEYFWFDTQITIPEQHAGKCVIFELATGREQAWDAINPQFTIYINGILRQGLDINHRSIILTENAVAGSQFRITLSAFTGDRNFNLLLHSKIQVLDRLTEKYYYDVAVPYQVAKLLNKDDKAYIDIILSLNNSLNLLDLRKKYSQAYYQSLDLAQKNILEQFYHKHCGNEESTVFCIGHTHIDLAWMWTIEVTKDKVVRSFSTVLELMDKYPDYLFMSSQPQLYKYVKKNAPTVYEKIKQKILEDRWEADGAMFVEADCNLASGESLVRQIMVGKRFFKDEFGVDNEILWLPDVFGYSAALPQIMLKSGIKYFMTTKISWNEFNKIPYDSFEWIGIDGSRVLTHFIPTRDYNTPAIPGGFQTEHYTTYNGFLTPSQVKGCWQRYQQKHLNTEVLMAFGHGDGGGGPTREMLETQRRLAQGIPGCPRTRMATVRDFFKTLEQHVKGRKFLPVWIGELYLEYHRGTYTSMARNKKSNRKAEFAWLNVEWLSCLNLLLNQAHYPKEKILEGWEIVLRNQFHDILPGSSIKEVYEDSQAEYECAFALSDDLISHTADAIVTKIMHSPSVADQIVVLNPNGFNADGPITFEIPAEYGQPYIQIDGETTACQQVDGNQWLACVRNVPSKGFRSFRLTGIGQEPNVIQKHLSTPLHVATDRMSNEFLSIQLNKKGQFVSIFDRKANRELLPAGSCANVLMSYEDKPHNFDAWDLNHYYQEKSWEIDDIQSIQVIEQGPVRGCLQIKRKYLDSTIIQSIYIWRDHARIDIRNEIDWQESQIFLKALFPVDIHTSQATFDIQYGNVQRQTHSNTSWDFARFEVCVHKWLDISEDDYGVSFLNDCKYGCSILSGVVGLSMLKSAIDPNPEADKEHHDFVFSILPHKGDWRQACTVQQAYILNNPFIAIPYHTVEDMEVPESYQELSFSLIQADRENVIIEVVKQAEDSSDLIVRFYDCYNRRTDVGLIFGRSIAKVFECDLMENNLSELTPTDSDSLERSIVQLTLMPYEIKTLKVEFEGMNINQSSISQEDLR